MKHDTKVRVTICFDSEIYYDHNVRNEVLTRAQAADAVYRALQQNFVADIGSGVETGLVSFPVKGEPRVKVEVIEE